MIVKVQVSPGTPPRVLFYNKDKTILSEFDADRDIMKLMRRRKKAFFLAELDHGELQIFEEVPHEDW